MLSLSRNSDNRTIDHLDLSRFGAFISATTRRNNSSNMVNRMTMKKAVHFGTNEAVETIEVECLKEHTSMLWWTRQEVREIEDESETLIHFMNIHMNNTNTSSSDWNQYPIEIGATTHTIRGLEKRTEIGAWDVFELQRDARNAVLNQQDKHRQSKSSSFDIHEAIAKAYRASTLNARRTAYEVGLKDQVEADRCHKEESIATRRTKQHQQQATRLPSIPVARRLSKTIFLTSEPICTKTRRTSSVLLPASKDSNVSSPATSEKKLILNTSDRIGMAPRLGFDFTPTKKRRPTDVLETCAVTELPDDMTQHVESPRRKKLTDLIIDLNLLQMQPQQEETTTEGSESILVAPVSRKKTVRKKKVDGSVVLDDNVLQALQDNGTAVIKKKKKKKSSSSGDKSKGDARPKRKSPKRSTSRDSSHGNATTDTEPMLDMSSSSGMSIHSDEIFQFDEFNGESHHGNVCSSNSCVFENSQPSITSFQDSFITI